MIRALTILAAIAALVVPAAQYIDDALGTGVGKLGASVALAAPGVATDEPDASAEVSLLYRGAVAVGKDGNGVRAARFATTVAGRGVRYVLLIENGCAGTDPATDPARPCPAPVRELTVTLNEDVVFQNDDEFREARLQIPLNPDEADDNSLVLAAKGAPGSGARVRILALRQPVKPKSKPPVKVLGLVYRDRVEVGADGNGVRAARFATTVAGRGVRYVLLIENGCAGTDPATDPARPCPAPVRELTVTLNEDVVFQNDDEFREARLQIRLNPDEGDDNSLVLAAKGAPGSGARVRILALRQPVKPKSKPPVKVLGLVYRDRVEVGADGNGVRAARFATTVAGRGVRYVLLIENGCAGTDPATDPARPCPAPVRELTVTLNEDVVFQNDDEFREARLQIRLNPDEGDDNSLVLAAKGAPGSGARVRILALRQPVKPKSKPPVKVLGLVYRDRVEVGADGNGVRAARFATTVAGRGVRYVLLIENGCAGTDPATDPARPCPAPVRELTVTLNEDVVFQNDDEFREARLQIRLNPDEGDDNSLVLAAKGAPGSGARVRILALRAAPLDQA